MSSYYCPVSWSDILTFSRNRFAKLRNTSSIISNYNSLSFHSDATIMPCLRHGPIQSRSLSSLEIVFPLLLQRRRELMQIYLMNFLTLSLLFVNSSYSTDQHKDALWTMSSSPIAQTVAREMFPVENIGVEDFKFDEEASETKPQFFKTSVKGVGVKVARNNNNNRQDMNSRSSKTSESMHVQRAFDAPSMRPMYQPMETLPGLDLEIDAIGLGGIPPGVRIENRNGRPVVEIMPNLGGWSSALDFSFDKPTFKHPFSPRNYPDSEGSKEIPVSHSSDASLASTHRPTPAPSSTTSLPTEGRTTRKISTSQRPTRMPLMPVTEQINVIRSKVSVRSKWRWCHICRHLVMMFCWSKFLTKNVMCFCRKTQT